MSLEVSNDKCVTVNDDVIQCFMDVAYSQTKTRVDEKSFKSLVLEMFRYVRLFNAMSEYQTRILDRQLDEVEVIDELVPFILPSKVKLDISDDRTVDVLVRDVMMDKAKEFEGNMSYERFRLIQMRFRNCFKSDVKQGLTSLAQIKVPQNLMNVIDKISICRRVDIVLSYDKSTNTQKEEIKSSNQWMCHKTSEPFIPIPVKAWVGQLYESDYFYDYSDEVIRQFIINRHFC